MPVDPIVSSTIFGLLYKHISLSMLCVTKQSMFFMLPLSSMALVDTEPRLHLRPAEPLVTAMSILLWVALLLQRTQRDSCLSRNPRQVLHQDLVTRRATSCASSSNVLTVCLLGIVLGEKQRVPASCLEEAPWDALTTSILNTW